MEVCSLTRRRTSICPTAITARGPGQISVVSAGNGGLLTAVAMMAAGWAGGSQRHARVPSGWVLGGGLGRIAPDAVKNLRLLCYLGNAQTNRGGVILRFDRSMNEGKPDLFCAES